MAKEYVEKEFYAWWEGMRTVAPGRFKVDGNKLFVRVPVWGGLWKKWQFVLSDYSGLLDDYDEYTLFSHTEGETDTKVRKYPYDFYTKEKFSHEIRDDTRRELEGLRTENDQLKMMLAQLRDQLGVDEHDDLAREKILREMNLYKPLLAQGFSPSKPKDKK